MKHKIIAVCTSILVLLSCFLWGNTSASAVDTAPDDFQMADVVALQKFLLNIDDTASTLDYDISQDGKLDGVDLSQMKHLIFWQTETTDSKILVAYFSCTGTTETIAEYTAEILDADLWEIVPEIPYTEADCNYGDSDSRTSLEQNDSTARPAISGTLTNMADYDTVFLGYPIWWGQAPKIISTFLESYVFSGKTIVPFCTSASSGIGTSATNLHALCPDDTTWLDGIRMSSRTTYEQTEEWISGLPLMEVEETNMMYLTIGDRKLTAELFDNPSAADFQALLKNGAMTITLSDFGNFEKGGSLGTTLTRSDAQTDIEPGDIILYQGGTITIYYEPSAWNLTKLGKIQDISQAELKELLGSGDVTVTFSLT